MRGDDLRSGGGNSSTERVVTCATQRRPLNGSPSIAEAELSLRPFLRRAVPCALARGRPLAPGPSRLYTHRRVEAVADQVGRVCSNGRLRQRQCSSSISGFNRRVLLGGGAARDDPTLARSSASKTPVPRPSMPNALAGSPASASAARTPGYLRRAWRPQHVDHPRLANPRRPTRRR